jgi:hypothetical protein
MTNRAPFRAVHFTQKSQFWDKYMVLLESLCSLPTWLLINLLLFMNFSIKTFKIYPLYFHQIKSPWWLYHELHINMREQKIVQKIILTVLFLWNIYSLCYFCFLCDVVNTYFLCFISKQFQDEKKRYLDISRFNTSLRHAFTIEFTLFIIIKVLIMFVFYSSFFPICILYFTSNHWPHYAFVFFLNILLIDMKNNFIFSQ